MSSTEKQTSKYFKIETTRLSASLECAKSSLAHQLANYGLPFSRLDFLPNFGFLCLKFRSRNAKKLINGSNDLNYRLVSNKTLNLKLAHWVAKGMMTSAKNAWTYPHYDVTLNKTKPKLFQFCKKYKLQDFPASLEGLNSALSQLASELWLCKIQQKSGTLGTERVNTLRGGVRYIKSQLFI